MHIYSILSQISHLFLLRVLRPRLWSYLQSYCQSHPSMILSVAAIPRLLLCWPATMTTDIPLTNPSHNYSQRYIPRPTTIPQPHLLHTRTTVGWHLQVIRPCSRRPLTLGIRCPEIIRYRKIGRLDLHELLAQTKRRGSVLNIVPIFLGKRNGRCGICANLILI